MGENILQVMRRERARHNSPSQEEFHAKFNLMMYNLFR